MSLWVNETLGMLGNQHSFERGLLRYASTLCQLEASFGSSTTAITNRNVSQIKIGNTS